jgi:cytochrome bd-type quinol oxidase subunit 1
MSPQQTVNGAEQQGLGLLLRGIVNDAQDLVKAQMDLLKSEITSDMRKTREAVAIFGAGVTVAFVGGLLLCLMLVFLLHWLTMPSNNDPASLPLWACFGLVGAVITGGGAILIYLGRQKFAAFNPLPEETAQGIKETLEWKTNPK